MRAVKATFDGEKVILPDGLSDIPAGEVIVVFHLDDDRGEDALDWLKAQEEAFARAWSDDEDSVYDAL